ncbi:RNI-like protein [Neoconidiobolus thromboides FSU 785]|nr:RNI-like protein [Neoconidiobolus thromboides FSU 785]
MRKLLEVAKSSGKLALNNRGLESLPDSMFSEFQVGKRSVTVDLSGNNDRVQWWEQKEITKLYLNDNQLKNIDERIMENFKELIVVDLMNNRIQEITTKVDGFFNLKILNLSHNKLQHLPQELFNLKLTELNLSHNEIQDFNYNILNKEINETLVTLNLSNNFITNIHDSINQLNKLVNLDLSNNKLQQLPIEIKELQSLTTLNLKRNRLESIPFFEYESKLNKLNYLDCSFNRIKELQSNNNNNSTYSQLKQLNLSNNQLSNIHDILLQTPSITSLILNNNQFFEFPENIIKLNQLTMLDISNNQLKNIDYKLGYLNNLKQFLFEGNSLRALPKIHNVGMEEFLTILRQREELNASNNKDKENNNNNSNNINSNQQNNNNNNNNEIIVNNNNDNNQQLLLFDKDSLIPFSKHELVNQIIKLNNQQLNDIQIDESMQGNLPIIPKVIDFEKNQLSEFPKSLYLYKDSLETIKLNNNLLKKVQINQIFFKLNNLELKYNKLIEFPFVKENNSDIPLFPNLKTLNLGFNNIQELPTIELQHTHVPNLTSLLITNNQIEDIKQSLSFLIKIPYLDLSNNQIKSLPPMIACEESKVKTLEVLGNAFLFPRYQILQKGSSYLLEYLKGRIPKQ